MRSSAVVLALVLGLAGWTTLAQEHQREDYESGAYLYRAFCASCHGQTGKGDGPVADILPRRPTDLTLMSKRRGGTFPRAEVLAVLDGTKQVPGHDGTAMPNWHQVFRTTGGGDDRVVRRRLEALADHLESLQVK